MEGSRSSDADLRAAIAGDRDAAARLLVQCGERLSRRIARRLELNPYVDFSAEDVLQEAYVDAFVGMHRFDPELGTSFAAWLEKIVDNRLVSMLRAEQRTKRGGEARKVGNDAWRSSAAELSAALADHRLAAPSDKVARDEVATAIRAGAAQLPEGQRQAIETHVFDGRSIDSTAEVLGKTDGAVRGLIYRAKQSMRATLGNSSRWFRRK